MLSNMRISISKLTEETDRQWQHQYGSQLTVIIMIYVVTRTETGKVKRLRNNSKVRIVPSGIRGQPKGEWLNGIATFATPEQLEHALKQRNKKYGFKARLSGLFSVLKAT